MKNKIWILVSLSVVLGLLIGGFACAGPAPSPTSTPTSTATTTPKPTQTPSPTTSPSPTPSPSPTQTQVIRWKAQANSTMNQPVPDRFKGRQWDIGSGCYGQFMRDWYTKRTGGRLVIDVAQPGALVPVADMMTAVERGTLDCAAHYGGYHTGIIPEANVELGLPFAWETLQEGWDAMQNWGLQKEFEKIYAEHNIYPIIYPLGISYSIPSTFPINSPDDLKGKKIRALALYGDLASAFGAAPTSMPMPDVYMAMKLGTVDGAIIGPNALEDYKLKEVAKYIVILPRFNTIMASSYFNLKSLNALPQDIRDIIINETPYAVFDFIMNYSISNCDWIPLKAQKDGYLKTIKWSEADIAKARVAGFALWDKVAALSPRTAQLVNIVKQQMKDSGKM